MLVHPYPISYISLSDWLILADLDKIFGFGQTIMFAFISFLTNCILSKICVPRELPKFSYGMVFNQDKQKKIVHSLTVCDRRLFLPQNPAQTPSVYMPCRRHRPLN